MPTLALTLEPDYDREVAAGAKALKPGKRWVVMDIRVPDGWLRHVAPCLVPLVRPFGAALEVAKRHPWESIARYLVDVSYEDHYFGFIYIAAGAARCEPEDNPAFALAFAALPCAATYFSCAASISSRSAVSKSFLIAPLFLLSRMFIACPHSGQTTLSALRSCLSTTLNRLRHFTFWQWNVWDI